MQAGELARGCQGGGTGPPAGPASQQQKSAHAAEPACRAGRVVPRTIFHIGHSLTDRMAGLLNAMLEMGLSRPWPEALEAMTGETEMDATAILDYFAPLKAWLDEKNEGHPVGW